MKNAGYTKQERSFIALMRVLAIAFLGTATLFAVMPNYLPGYLTSVGNGLFNWGAPPFPQLSDHFWAVHSAVYMLLLSYLCMVAQHNIVRNIGYTRPVIIATILASIGFCVCFFLCGEHFVYLVTAVLNGAAGIVTWRFYHRAQKSRT